MEKNQNVINFWMSIFAEVKQRQEAGADWDYQSVICSVFHINRFKNIPDLTNVEISDVIEDWLDYQMLPRDKRIVQDTKIESLIKMREKTLPGEIWKVCAGFPDYMVSSYGRVWSTKHRNGLMTMSAKWKKGRMTKRQYVTINIDGRKAKQSVHRLVALTFIPNPDGLPEVDHINEDVTDNRVENLRWCTGEQNRQWYADKHYTAEGDAPSNLSSEL